MGNTSSTYEEAWIKKVDYTEKALEKCFLCKEKVAYPLSFPNERYYNSLQRSRYYNTEEDVPYGYSVCGNCNKIESNHYNISTHKTKLKLEQYNKLGISPFIIEKLHEWDIKNSLYHQTLQVHGDKTCSYMFKGYGSESILKIEKDKIVIYDGPNPYTLRGYYRRIFATNILGMDNGDYNRFRDITEQLNEKVVIYLKEEGDTYDEKKDRWEKEQVGDIITFRRIGVSLI
jgi:hypothetical protein